MLWAGVEKNTGRFVALGLSALVGLEYNFILNPLYTDFGKVEILDYIALPLDARLKG
jgi:hypothetical protein